jgi:hypothetical protein
MEGRIGTQHSIGGQQNLAPSALARRHIPLVAYLQWWSNVATHLLQLRQWCARAGCRTGQEGHGLQPAAAWMRAAAMTPESSVDRADAAAGSLTATVCVSLAAVAGGFDAASVGWSSV